MVSARASGDFTKDNHPPASSHGGFEEVFEGVWFVRGGVRLQMRLAIEIGRAMTVVRGEDGLTLFNSMRLSEEGELKGADT